MGQTIKINCKGSGALPLGEMKPFQGNLKTLTEKSYVKLRGLIQSMGFSFPIFVWQDRENNQNYIIDGHQRVRTLQKMASEGYQIPDLPVAFVEAPNFKEAKKKLMAAASQFGDVDKQGLYEFLSENQWDMDFLEENFKLPEIDFDSFKAEYYDDSKGGGEGDGEEGDEKQLGSMADKFLIPPFTVFDARQGYWVERKRKWLELGIESEVGRGNIPLKKRAPDHFVHQGSLNKIRGNELFKTGTSIFDPVLCEIAYRWWCPVGGSILDPFAGGSVRGIVASKLGFKYTGIELRMEQTEANVAQAADICADDEVKPTWICGDSSEQLNSMKGRFDFMIGCPPYYDLEKYSDDPKDISNMSYSDFLETYTKIIQKALKRLKENALVVWVICDVRQTDGDRFYWGFLKDTIQAFEEGGAELYNEAVLLTSIGSLPLRAGKTFMAGRKLGRSHQNVLVFAKGSPAKIMPKLEKFEGNEAEMMKMVDYENLEFCDNMDQDTPVQEIEADKMKLWVKRDDFFAIGGVRGGKVRTCWWLAQGAEGLVTAGSRSSAQVNIVAHIARKLGIPCQVHTPEGKLSPEVEAALRAGAEVVQHKAGYNNVIMARAREAAKKVGWTEIPFRLECQAAVDQTRKSVKGLDLYPWKRLVLPVGSGMSLAGVLWGLKDHGIDRPVLGVKVGADPRNRLDKYAPPGWQDMVDLLQSDMDYHESPHSCQLGPIWLDPLYEAKCINFLKSGDCLWVVGISQTAQGGLDGVIA